MSEYTKESIEYRGYRVEIVSDDDSENPRVEHDNCGVMCCWHNRYNLGDMDRDKPISDSYSEPIDLLYELAGIGREEAQEENYIQGIIRNLNNWLDSKNKQIESIPYDELYEFIDNYSYGRNYADEDDYSLYLVARFMEETVYDKGCDHDDLSYSELYDRIEKRGTIILPLYLYDHSGITMSTSSFNCRWDSGQVGYIYMTKETIEKEGWTKEQATNYLEGEVETYDQYLTGDVWGWRVIDNDDDIIESCYGYYGDAGVEDAIKEGKSTIDYLCKKAQEEYEKTHPKRKAAEMYTI
jgi:hypothetical protein